MRQLLLMPDVFTKEKRSEVMSRIRSRGSKIEVKMLNALESNNIVFEYQPKLFGNPDFLVKPNVVVFCDSSFWHGRNWKKLRLQLMEGYWREHIGKNIKRDRSVNNDLRKQGYKVLRFWDDEIGKATHSCIEKIQEALSSTR
jgi:DNA mismatch endonuclease (patch repair protein)